jgi:hypothetical protein
MATTSDLIFHVAVEQKQPRFLVTFFVQIMQQLRIGFARHLSGQFVEPRKNRQEIWFAVGMD